MASNPAFWTASMRLGCGVAVWLLAGCNLESGFFEKSTTEESTWRGKLGQQVTNVDVVASEEDAGVVTAALDSNATTTQVALAAADSAISGAQVAFPPGALGISTSISLQEGQSLAAAGFATELGLGTGVSQAAPALMVMP